MADKNSLPRVRSKKQWLPRSRENQKKNKPTRAMPNGQYWVFNFNLHISYLFTNVNTWNYKYFLPKIKEEQRMY